jgi:hypothetical protein
MAFVNEYIPEEDYEKYGLDELDRSISPPAIPGGHVYSRDWTIDRKRNIYLREFSSENDPYETPCTGWTFFWKGELLWFVKWWISGGGEKNGPQWEKSKITHLVIPDHLLAHQTEICNDIHEAFQVYAGGGVFSSATEYREEIHFDMEKGEE